MTVFERTVSLAVAVIGCAAAVIMVPEVRCMAGLDDGIACAGSVGVTPLYPASTLRVAPPPDPRIAPIRTRYNWIERNPSRLMRFEPMPIRMRSADSASIVVYTDDGGIAKITARVYNGRERNVLKFYYTGGGLVFVHQVMQQLNPETNQYEQRFYFERDQLFRWLAPDNRSVPASAPDFADTGQYLAAMGAELGSMAAEMLRGT